MFHLISIRNDFIEIQYVNFIAAKPSDAKGSAKWDAWYSKKGMSDNVAKEKYVAKVKVLSSSYA